MTLDTLPTSEQYRRFVNLSSVGSLEPITVDRAEGSELWDVDGTHYVDCFAGIAVVNVGHVEPRVVEAAAAQMERLVHCGTYLYQVPVVGELAARLAEVTPGRLQKTFFCNSGAEAIEGALRLARSFTGRTEFIADEVQSGFGRTGKLFAIEHYGVEADIMALAKGIADGFPLGGFIARPEVADSFRPGEHLSTFGGNPVSCAAGVASLRVLEEDGLVEHAATLGAWLLDRLHDLASRHRAVGDVRGIGLMCGMELVSDRGARTPAPDLALRVRTLCRERGVLVGVGGFFGDVVRIQPPLSITQDQLGFGVGSMGILASTVANSGNITRAGTYLLNGVVAPGAVFPNALVWLVSTVVMALVVLLAVRGIRPTIVVQVIIIVFEYSIVVLF